MSKSSRKLNFFFDTKFILQSIQFDPIGRINSILFSAIMSFLDNESVFENDCISYKHRVSLLESIEDLCDNPNDFENLANEILKFVSSCEDSDKCEICCRDFCLTHEFFVWCHTCYSRVCLCCYINRMRVTSMKFSRLHPFYERRFCDICWELYQKHQKK